MTTRSPLPSMNPTRTKIVATLGPATASVESIRKVIDAGASVLRLNTAHGSSDELDTMMDRIDLVREQTRPIAVLVDLAGPKIRLGELPDAMVECHEGDVFGFVPFAKRDEYPELQQPGSKLLTSNYAQLTDDLQLNDSILLADGTVCMMVCDKSDEIVRCRVVNSGVIRSRQGINLPGVRLSLPGLTERDREFTAWAAKRDADFVSLSFVRSASDIRELRALLASLGSTAPIVAKIEKPEALDNLVDIVTASDAIMVARGDLGVEIDVAEVPVKQKMIIETCNRLQRPVIVATQMLDSMEEEPRPTRAEASDVANAILDGADACMLSGESAIGKYPIEAVSMMRRIMLSTERLLEKRQPRPPAEIANTVAHPITQSVVFGAARIAEYIGAKCVVVATQSGNTALAKSSQRDFTPAIVVSPSESVLRRMCLLWGVTPLAGVQLHPPITMREFVIQWGKQTGLLADGDPVV
ncbi:MAG: pyruvate kinase, partial [Planctomycetales bacterium]|nr:pyruvate kinase [Planctomycetales bacterium]